MNSATISGIIVETVESLSRKITGVDGRRWTVCFNIGYNTYNFIESGATVRRQPFTVNRKSWLT
ncbi:MAG: hypothetical protein AB8G22_14065 [Saprospiraceae bacterium]